MRCAAALFFLLVADLAAAQATLSGRVIDSESREPLPFTNVFVNNTTIGTAADANGTFRLTGIPAGISEIVFSFVGYQTYKLKVDLAPAQNMQTEVRLIADGKILENVKVEGKRDKIWENQFKRFSKTFLGRGKNAEQCKINNSWVLEFSESGNDLIAKASNVLEIENTSMGYRIFYSLKKFTADGLSFTIIGDARFQEMKTDDVKLKNDWSQNRLNAYLGSQRHLMKALLKQRLRHENFRLYVDKTGFENSPRYATFARELGHSIEEFDSTRIQIVPSDPNRFVVTLPRKLEVHYVSGASRIASYDDVIHPVSWLELRNGTVKVNANGTVLDPEDMVASGYMSSLRMADMLPNDYEPQAEDVQKIQSIKPGAKSFEKVYVHTDKPYYYPGERVWFKAYMNYYVQRMRDSLSNVLYVELINPSLDIISRKVLWLDSGLTSGNFILPDSTRSGNWYVRAYTQFQRNFGDENLLLKPLPVLNPTTKPVYNADQKQAAISDKLNVAPDKASYKKREKVTLTLALENEESGPVSGNFSVSVTDDSQVISVPEWGNIKDKFPIRDEEAGKPAGSAWPVEQGITLHGQFMNNKGRGERTPLNIIQFYPNQLMVTETDEQGFFDVRNLQFYGSGTFSIQATKSIKLKETGKVVIMEDKTPPLKSPLSAYSFPVVEMNAVQRILSAYEKPFDSRMLDEVEIRGKRESSTVESGVSTARPYGKADYVFDESRIKTQFPNLLYTLQALNISGLVVNPYTATVFFARNSKIVTYLPPGVSVEEMEKKYTPLVTLDNMPLVGGSAGEILQGIPPDNVASIEVTKGGSAIRGSQAPFGVIAVYTKKRIQSNGVSANLNLVTAQGYALQDRFLHPDYAYPSPEHSSPDYRSTLYWNPDVSIGHSGKPAQVYFYTSDLAGTYRVVVEGVTGKGDPVRSVTFITVKE